MLQQKKLGQDETTNEKKQNVILSIAENTKKHWAEIRVFSSTGFGNYEILLESRMDSIKLKKIQEVHEPANEMYIKVNDFEGMNKILRLINSTFNKPNMNIANSIEIQILLNNDATKELVEEFANHLIQNKDTF
jgi:hypothetical protein